MTDYLRLRRFIVARSGIDKGHEHLRKVGRRGLEGFVLWAGRPEGDEFRVLEVIIPDQVGHRTRSGVCVTVDGAALHRINVHLFRQGMMIGAQMHSHPTEAYHSDTDDTYAIATKLGSLSIVVPDFAATPFLVSRCAVYRLSKNGWIEVNPAQTQALIQIED